MISPDERKNRRIRRFPQQTKETAHSGEANMLHGVVYGMRMSNGRVNSRGEKL